MARRNIQGGNSYNGSGISTFPKIPRGKILVLDDCLYVPNIRRNLILVFSLLCNGFSAIFNKNFVLLNMMLMKSVVEC